MAKYISRFQIAFLESSLLLVARQVPELPLNLYFRKSKTKQKAPNKQIQQPQQLWSVNNSQLQQLNTENQKEFVQDLFSSAAEAVLSFIFKCLKWLATMCLSFMLTELQNPNAVHSCHNFIYNRIYFWIYTICESHKRLQELCMSNKLKQIERRRGYRYPASQGIDPELCFS